MKRVQQPFGWESLGSQGIWVSEFLHRPINVPQWPSLRSGSADTPVYFMEIVGTPTCPIDLLGQFNLWD